MANHKSAKKRIRTNDRKRVRNKASLSKVKTLVKNVFDSEEQAKGTENLKVAVSFLDRTVCKGRMPKNTASRKKSQMTKFVGNLTA
ncbi:MAG: 30S ribosomal protein S20 [Ignavibacteriae bacterium]|nr:30S ribosomal protein S20 [Ignavibacteriota bacterium]